MVRARPRRGALGLRGRIVGAVLVTTVATLGVAALALLGPLQRQLRNAALNTLRGEVRAQKASFERLELADLQSDRSVQTTLDNTANTLAVRSGASEVVLFGYP